MDKIKYLLGDLVVCQGYTKPESNYGLYFWNIYIVLKGFRRNCISMKTVTHTMETNATFSMDF